MPLFSRIARSFQDRVSNNPDGALAKYVWLWQSMGKRPGQRLIPRPIRFFFVASLDVFSLVGWYIRTGIRRVGRSARSMEAIMSFARTNRIAAFAIVAGGVIGASLSFSFLGSRSVDVPAIDAVVASSPLSVSGFEFGDIRRRCRMERLSTDVEQARVLAGDLAREQRDVEADVNRLAGDGSGPSSEAGRRLLERKDAMVDEIDDLRVEIQRLKNNAWAYRREASDLLVDATSTIEDSKLRDRVRFSQSLIGSRDTEYNMRQFEAETTPIFDELYEELQRASDAVIGENQADAQRDPDLIAILRGLNRSCQVLLGATPMPPNFVLVF